MGIERAHLGGGVQGDGSGMGSLYCPAWTAMTQLASIDLAALKQRAAGARPRSCGFGALGVAGVADPGRTSGT